MGSKDPLPNINEWVKFPWEGKQQAVISKSDVASLQAEMAALNGIH